MSQVEHNPQLRSILDKMLIECKENADKHEANGKSSRSSESAAMFAQAAANNRLAFAQIASVLAALIPNNRS